MDQQTEWPATPLHFLYNNTILWCIHAPQANPPPPPPWANGRENYCHYFPRRSCFLSKRVPDDRNFLSEVVRHSGMEEAGDLEGTYLTTRGVRL